MPTRTKRSMGGGKVKRTASSQTPSPTTSPVGQPTVSLAGGTKARMRPGESVADVEKRFAVTGGSKASTTPETMAETATTPEQAPPPSQTGTPTPTTPEETGMVAYESAVRNLESGGLQGGALAAAKQNLAGKYQRGFEAATAAGTEAPQDAGQARLQAQAYTPEEPDTATVDQIFSEDPTIQGIMEQVTELLNPEEEKRSLLDDYKRLYRQLDIEDINEELIDAETILDGTEDDIRNEIQTAGGFGTESQVQAMTLARNKGLLKRYNQLFAQKQMAEQQLQTMMNLTAQDRQMAEQRVQSQLSTMFNLANFRQQSINATRETYKWLGAETLYNSVQGDPAKVSRVERVLGIPSGALATAAATATEQRNLQERLLRAQIGKAEADAAGEAATGTSAQSTFSQVQFLQNTVTKAKGLSDGAGQSGAEKFFGNLFVGDTKRNRLQAQVRTLQSNMLTLATDPNIKKFFGPQMSEKDVEQMLAAATTLNVDEMSQEDLELELDRIDSVLSKFQDTNIPEPGDTAYDPSGGAWIVEP